MSFPNAVEPRRQEVENVAFGHFSAQVIGDLLVVPLRSLGHPVYGIEEPLRAPGDDLRDAKEEEAEI